MKVEFLKAELVAVQENKSFFAEFQKLDRHEQLATVTSAVKTSFEKDTALPVAANLKTSALLKSFLLTQPDSPDFDGVVFETALELESPGESADISLALAARAAVAKLHSELFDAEKTDRVAALTVANTVLFGLLGDLLAALHTQEDCPLVRKAEPVLRWALQKLSANSPFSDSSDRTQRIALRQLVDSLCDRPMSVFSLALESLLEAETNKNELALLSAAPTESRCVARKPVQVLFVDRTRVRDDRALKEPFVFNPPTHTVEEAVEKEHQRAVRKGVPHSCDSLPVVRDVEKRPDGEEEERQRAVVWDEFKERVEKGSGRLM